MRASVESPSTRHRSLGKRTRRGVAWAFLREGGTELLVFPGSLVLARLISPEEFGIAAAAGFFTLLAGQLSGLGLNAALIRIKDLRPEHYSTVFAINIGVGLLMWAALSAGAPFIAAFYEVPETAEVVLVGALGFLIAPFGTVPAAALTRDLKFRETAVADWAHVVAFTGTAVLLAWYGFSYMSMVYGRIAGLVTLTAVRIVLSPWKPTLAFSMPALREILSFGAGVHAKRLLEFSARNIDNLLVGRLYGMTALGIYDKAFSTAQRILSRLNTGGPGLTFRIFSMIHDEPRRFVAAYQKVVLSATLLAFPMFAVLAVVAPRLITLLFGEVWRPAAIPFQILCLDGCLKVLNAYASSAVQATGRVWSEVWRQLSYVGLLIACLVLLRSWGVAGVAVSVLVATTLLAVLMHALLLEVTELRAVDLVRALYPALVCAAACAGAVVLAERGLAAAHLTGSILLVLVVQAIVASVCYAAFLILAPMASLRALVCEVGTDLAPPALKRQRWVRQILRVADAPG